VPQEGNTKHARVGCISYTLSRDTTQICTTTHIPYEARDPVPALHGEACLGKVCQGHVEHGQAGTGSRGRPLPPAHTTGPCVTGVPCVPGQWGFDTPWSQTLDAAQASP
jgi:hypothetical protein